MHCLTGIHLSTRMGEEPTNISTAPFAIPQGAIADITISIPWWVPSPTVIQITGTNR